MAADAAQARHVPAGAGLWRLEASARLHAWLFVGIALGAEQALQRLGCCMEGRDGLVPGALLRARGMAP